MPGHFDPQMEVNGFNLIKGTAETIVVVDPIAPNPPFVKNLVVDGTKPFDLIVKWELEGYLVPVWLGALGGAGAEWHIEVFAESIGPGPEKRIASKTVAVGPIVNPKTYSETLTVPANTLPEGNPLANDPSGIYKITACIFLNSSFGPPGYDIAGFAEGPRIKIENPV